MVKLQLLRLGVGTPQRAELNNNPLLLHPEGEAFIQRALGDRVRDARFDRQPRRREVMQAANEWFTKAAGDHREAYDASRAPPRKGSAEMHGRKSTSTG